MVADLSTTRFCDSAGLRHLLLDPAGRQLPVSLQLAGGPPEEPVRVHLDLYTSEQARHVERLVTLGAIRVDEWPYPDGADFVVLRDPDGNEFCVIGHPGQLAHG